MFFNQNKSTEVLLYHLSLDKEVRSLSTLQKNNSTHFNPKGYGHLH